MVSKNWEGVYARASSIRVTFVYNGAKHFETLSLPPTPANMKYADSVRKEILRRIELGTFTFSEFFPKSKHAAKTDRPLFSEMAESWLNSKTRALAETTLKEYRNTINTHFTKPFGKRIMADITFREIDKFMSDLKVANKTFNNVLSVLRGIYEYGMKAKACSENHAAHIEFAPKDEPKPDPLNQQEVNEILRDMNEHYDEQIAIYFELAILLGFRPSEGIDLRWSNVDWNKGLLLISSAKVRTVTKKTKTSKDRLVELDDQCLALLQRLKKYTFMKGDHIFVYPVTGRPYPDTSNLVEKYWRPSLKRCGIRNRDARQTRHTCASMMLMAGCEPDWAAGQLGHSVEMFYRVYSKRIQGEDKGRERAKMASMYGESCQIFANSKSS